MDCKLEGRGDSVALPYGADTITLDKGDLRISFHRTIRVPDSSTSESFLPPDLGVYPLFPAKKARSWGSANVVFPTQIPEWLKAKGGVFFPMHENEATWIKFEAEFRRPYAIKVYVGGVNAVTGLPSSANAVPEQQDYLVIPAQRWLDGIAVRAGLVRQFAAVPLGNNRTVEGQVTGTERFGGIQFEVVWGIVPKHFQVQREDGTVIRISVNDRENVDGLSRVVSENLGQTFKTSDLYDTDKLIRLTRFGNKQLRSIKLTNIGICDMQNASLLEMVLRSECQVRDDQLFLNRGFYPARKYWNGAPTGELGLAAGGLIKQNVQADTYPSSTWDLSSKTVFNVQLVPARVFEEITGYAAPTAPINAATYKKYGLPFFDIPEPPSTVAGNFGRLKSLAHLLYLDGRDNDILLAPISDGGEFRSVKEQRRNEEGREQRLIPTQNLSMPTTGEIHVPRRGTRLQTTYNQSQSFGEGLSEEPTSLISTESRRADKVEDNGFYPDFDDDVNEIQGLPFGSSAQEVWSKIYFSGF